MDDQFVTVVLPPDDKRFRISKRQPLTVVGTTGSLLKHESKEKKEFTLPGCIPSFEELPSSSSAPTSAPRGLPPSQKYVLYRGKEVETDAEDAVEYDLDREDCVWLRMANERRRREGRKPLSESLMERCIDRLEKESHFQLAKSAAASAGASKSAAFFHLRPHHLDSDVPCCICNDDDTSDANLIIFCDMCNIAVHQECYGVPYIPEGQWLCRRCQLSPSAPVKCALCPFTNGAFKQTSDGQWAHVICAIWLSEVHFANTAFLEPIEGVSHSLKRRCKLRCLVCKRKGGACLQCSKRSCCRAFHVTCAQHAGMRMVIQEDRDRKTNAMIINRYVYCHKHSVNATEQDEIGKAAYKRSVDEQLRKARSQLVTCNREVPQVSIPVIPPKKITSEAKSKQSMGYPNTFHAALKERTAVIELYDLVTDGEELLIDWTDALKKIKSEIATPKPVQFPTKRRRDEEPEEINKARLLAREVAELDDEGRTQFDAELQRRKRRRISL